MPVTMPVFDGSGIVFVTTGESRYADLLRIDQRKCVLFTLDMTLYSVFIPGLKRPEFEHLSDVFGQRLFKALLWDEFPQAQIEQMLEFCRVIRFSTSNNRSVLGSMNDLRLQIEVNVAHAGGLANVDMFDLHHRLNRVPLSAVGYRYAVEGLAEHLRRM